MPHSSKNAHTNELESLFRGAAEEATHDERLVTRALKKGRMLGTGIELLSLMRAKPATAGPTMAQTLRKATYLHSRERRFVSDALYLALRFRNLVSDALQHPQDDPNFPTTLWLASVMLLGQLPKHSIEQAWAAIVEQPCPDFAQLEPPYSVLSQTLEQQDPVQRIATLGSIHPGFARALTRSLGEQAFSFLLTCNQRAPMDLRVNQRRANPQTVKQALEAEGISTDPLTLAVGGFRIHGRVNITASASYKSGHLEVQDEGSQLIAALVSEGDKIVDYCAGAGGKSLAIADALGDSVNLLCLDTRLTALKNLSRRAKRAGVKNIQTALVQRNSIHPSLWRAWREDADCVLVDAPCTGSGRLRRDPALRLRIDKAFIQQCQRQQLSILERAKAFVKPGGRLIYATCSVLTEENEDVIHAFLQENPNFKTITPQFQEPHALASCLTASGALQLTPHQHQTDGFFARVLQRH